MPHHRQPHRGPGGRRRRPLGHGDLRLLILDLIADTPRHGYDLITQIEARTGGSYKPSPGVMYPALEVLQDLGWAEVVPEDGKKTYQLTPTGKAALQENADTIAEINARLDTLAQPQDSDDPANVRAAMQRLHHDVRSRMRGGSVDEATRIQIAEIIETARSEIGKLGG